MKGFRSEPAAADGVGVPIEYNIGRAFATPVQTRTREMTLQAPNALDQFQWSPQPEAEKFVRALVEDFLQKNAFARDLARRMKDESGTRFYDWVEAIILPETPAITQRMQAVGYEKLRDRGAEYKNLWTNPLGMFPLIGFGEGGTTAIHLKVTSVADFADVWRLAKIEGEPGAPYRRVRASKEGDTELWAAERWGWVGFDLPKDDPARAIAMQRTLESFLTRKRDFDDDSDGYEHAVKLIDASPLGGDVKCALW